MWTAVVGIVEELFKRNVSDPGDVMREGKEEIREKYAFYICLRQQDTWWFQSL